MKVCNSTGQCFPSEEQAVKLLKEIIGLWVTIRGFSIAGTWMEQYMHANKNVSSKSKGLRKELKRTSTSNSETSL